jgi:LmbE family N-acetylglucosaminyl deacetylase
MNLLLSPHNDDEVLFAAFTVIREKPHVVVCFRGADGFGDPGVREDESRAAVAILGASAFKQWDLASCTDEAMRAYFVEFDNGGRYDRVYAPDLICTHREHLQVARCAADVFHGRLTTYHTYVHPRGDAWPVRVTSDRLVPYSPEDVALKLRALQCYATQIMHPRICDLFLQPQFEYYGVDA